MQDQIKAFIDYLEALDTCEVGAIGDKSIDEIVCDWGSVNYVTVSPDPDSVTLNGDRLAARASLEIVFNDQGTRTIDTMVIGRNNGDAMTMVSMTRMMIPA